MLSAPEPGIRLSVVIAAWNGVASLERCLASLKGQARTQDTEIIVVSNFNGTAPGRLEAEFPRFQLLRLPPDATVPVLRKTGILHSRGEIVALLEDHCTCGDAWCSEIVRAHDSENPVVGGPVENLSSDRLLDWAVYFYDYGKYMLPARAGQVGSLSGNNVSYRRSTLNEVADSFREGFHESVIHPELQHRGHRLYLQPSAVVYHQKSYRLGEAIGQCYHLARGFAGKRVSGASLPRRLAFVLGALVLPVLLPVRIILRTIGKRRHVRQLLLSLPYLLALLTSWSFGEFCGYFLGEGDSAARWR